MAEVRLLGEKDAPALWHLRLEALECEPRFFGETAEEHQRFSVETTATRLREGGPGNFVVGAFSDELLVGMAGFVRSDGIKTRHKGRVWGVYLRNASRGQGIARRMMEALLKEARAVDGLTTVVLTVAEENRAAVELYRHLGFREYGRDPCEIRIAGECFASLLMRCEL